MHAASVYPVVVVPAAFLHEYTGQYRNTLDDSIQSLFGCKGVSPDL